RNCWQGWPLAPESWQLNHDIFVKSRHRRLGAVIKRSPSSHKSPLNEDPSGSWISQAASSPHPFIVFAAERKVSAVKVVRTLKLWFREGASDKVYEVALVDTEAQTPEARFLVNIRYGRRGQVLRDGTKTPVPVSRAAAEKIFDSVIVSKVNDGYRRMDGAEPHAPSPGPAAAAWTGGLDRPPPLQPRRYLRPLYA